MPAKTMEVKENSLTPVAEATEVASLSAYGKARSTVQGAPLSADELRKTDAYWRACNYLSLGMIYLQDNPLLKEPLKPEHIKNRLLGHWGASPGLAFAYIHLNRLIKKYDLDMIFLAGPGHGAPGVLGPVYLEGTYSEIYPDKSEDTDGPAGVLQAVLLSRRHRQSLHSRNARLDPRRRRTRLRAVARLRRRLRQPRPDRRGGGRRRRIGNRPAGDFLAHQQVPEPDSRRRGPADPSPQRLQDQQPDAAGAHQPRGSGEPVPRLRLDAVLRRRLRPREHAPGDGRDSGAVRLGHQEGTSRKRAAPDVASRPRWPMIVLRTPKGWGAPEEVGGHRLEGFWRAHQVPLADVKKNPDSLKILENWMRAQKPEELFDANGKLIPELKELAPTGTRRMSANPHANGGLLKKASAPAGLPRLRLKVDKPGQIEAENTRPLGAFLRDVMKANMDRFRVFGPDENTSNKLQDIYEVSKKFWIAEYFPEDADGGELATDGRVIEMLSEHTLEGMLEGYLLTGRHGFFSTYEAFVHVIDSMFNQHAKWLSICNQLSWREEISSLNLLITSTVWRQDHNGFTHQDPGFLDVVVNKSADVTRIYLPPDVNSLLSVADHCLRSENYINVIVSDKQMHLQYLDMDAAIRHCTKGIGIWDWASNDQGGEPDVVMASAGDIPTQEALAATALLRADFPDLKIRFINVVDLFKLQPSTEHPHGLTRSGFRFAVHSRQADHLQLPRLSVADSPAGVPPHQSQQHARARIQGKGQHQYADGTGDQQRDRSLQPGDRRDRPYSEASAHRRPREGEIPQPADRLPQLRLRARHRQPGNIRVEVAALADGHWCSRCVRARSSRRWYFIRLRLLALLPGHLCAANPRPRIGSWASGSA